MLVCSLLFVVKCSRLSFCLLALLDVPFWAVVVYRFVDVCVPLCIVVVGSFVFGVVLSIV